MKTSLKDSAREMNESGLLAVELLWESCLKFKSEGGIISLF
jgi:hypothetical protein